MCFLPISLAFPRISYKVNQTVYILLCLASHTQHGDSETYPCHVCQYFIPFYCSVVFCCMGTSQFVYLYWWIFELFLIWCYYIKFCHEHSYIRLCVDIFAFLLDKYLRVRLLDSIMSVCLTIRNFQSVFQSHCAILHSRLQCIRVLAEEQVF